MNVTITTGGAVTVGCILGGVLAGNSYGRSAVVGGFAGFGAAVLVRSVIGF